MSAHVTPSRRRRESSDTLDDESQELSEGRHSNKRARSHSSEDERPGVDTNPLLPDSFRRTPQNSRRHDVSANGSSPRQYQPGSIVRVSMVDFVTYSKATFHPGPNLNMVIGPNGTGKSTLVCAICIGLGWGTATLGRAKDYGEFVKHGCDKARIEIELAADPDRHDSNPVITCVITKSGDKRDFLIDERKSNKRAVLDLARSFNIQVDNLCQFLPQDRVVEFSRLSPVDLLPATLRAAAPDHMLEWHDKLKTMRREEKAKLSEQQRGKEILTNRETRHEAQRSDYQRLQDRTNLQDRKTFLERCRPFPLYVAKKAQYRKVRAELKRAQRDLRRLEEQSAPNLEAIEAKSRYHENVERVKNSRQRLVERSETNVNTLSNKLTEKHAAIEEKRTEIKSVTEGTTQAKANKTTYERQIRDIELAIARDKPEDVDFASCNENIRELSRQVRAKQDGVTTFGDTIATLEGQGVQRLQIIKNLKQNRSNLNSQVGRQMSKLKTASRNGDAEKAWEWVERNRGKFQSPVFGPPMLTCSVKDPRYADAVESCIALSEMTAITVTNQKDFEMLQEEIYGEMKLSDVNLRSSLVPLTHFAPPCSQEQLQHFGLDSWVLDLIEGPEPVLAMLCDNRNLHRTAYSDDEMTSAQFEALSRSNISSFVTKSQSFQITRRAEYGDKATSTRVNSIKKARWFIDTPVDHGADQDLERQILEREGEFTELNNEIKSLKAQNRTLGTEIEALQDQKAALEKEKRQKQAVLTQYNALPTKKAGIEAKLQDAITTIKSARDQRLQLEQEIDELTLQKGQKALDFANALTSLQSLTSELLETEIIMLEARSEVEQLEIRQRDVLQMLENKRGEVGGLDQQAQESHAAGRALGAQCQSAFPEELDEHQESVLKEVQTWDPARLDTEIESLAARLEMVSGGNGNIVAEFEERKRRIEDDKRKLQALAEQLGELGGRIAELQQQWEPRVDALIAQISESFADNFQRIGTTGEVAVFKDEDFEQWAVQIKVKFRENESLSILDSHRQSGGERAITTIFYLMALQSLARAPFRVVDEINQGMDQRFERLVHSRMVDVACEENTSQYFLITPKLLNGLKYAEGMKVHCIASGEYMPDADANGLEGESLNFQELANHALRFKARAAAAAR